MKILHTADWHLGQLFYDYDRSFEHQCFLDWLLETLVTEQIDVLLISGDIFDIANPSASTVTQLYHFLGKAVQADPQLQIVIIAGNHDSAARLETPKPLLASFRIHIVGLLQRRTDGTINYDDLVIPLKDRKGDIRLWCMAVPFLRLGDYPVVSDTDYPYAEGVSTLYKVVYAHALEKKQPGQAIIAMGHLHVQHAEVTDMDKAERQIMGGVECISDQAFHPDIQYVALGHIHKAQRIGHLDHVRYSGSPIPMSFSERGYKHQVIVFEVESGKRKDMKAIEIPIAVALTRVPQAHQPLEEVLTLLHQLPETIETEKHFWPYLEVRVLLDMPEPALRHKIETALTGKRVRLAKIDVQYPSALTGTMVAEEGAAAQSLDQLSPVDLLQRVYQGRYGSEVPAEMLQLFNRVIADQAQGEH